MSDIPEDEVEKSSEVEQRTDTKILISTCIQFILLYIVLIMFDTLSDLLMGLLDLLVELFHLLLETLEFLVEQLLEHVFYTTHQQSEAIILNAVVVLMFLLGYRFFKSLPFLFNRFNHFLNHRWNEFIGQISCQWKSYSLALKLKLIVFYIVGLSGVFLFIG